MHPANDTSLKTRGAPWGGSGLGRGRGGRGSIIRPVMGGFRKPTVLPEPVLHVVPSQPPALAPVPEPRATPSEKVSKDIEGRKRVYPPHALVGIHPRLREPFRTRAPTRPLPTSEGSCNSCVEYEDFIEVHPESLPPLTQ